MNFTTDGMSLDERYDILNKVDLIPIGTTCYQAGKNSTEFTKEIVVGEENQKYVTMFWNCLFFLDKEQADYITDKAHAEYAKWLIQQEDLAMQIKGVIVHVTMKDTKNKKVLMK